MGLSGVIYIGLRVILGFIGVLSGYTIGVILG